MYEKEKSVKDNNKKRQRIPICTECDTAERIFKPEILRNSVSYQHAAQVRNNDGNFYEETGTHDNTYDIDAIFYDGYRDTKAFAYVGYPKGASGKKRVPAMVLVHGGWGRAEKAWVKKWNDAGFAAIAMDLYGDGPECDESNPYNTRMKKHPYAGVVPFGGETFLADYENAGMYQNVVAVVNAHNILIESGRVDTNKIGIAGISWGGVTALTAAGVDRRFAFAVSVYGCGFLEECRTYFSNFYEAEGCTDVWDPARFIVKTEAPVLLVNSDCDQAFSINSTSRTADAMKNGRLCILHHYGHSQELGESLSIVYRFAQKMADSTDNLVRIYGENVKNRVFTAAIDVPEGTGVSGAVLYYITSKELAYGGGTQIAWQSVENYAFCGSKLHFVVPEKATHCYMSVVDHDGNVISSKYLDVK